MQAGINEGMTGGPSVFDLPKLVPTRAGDIARIWIPDPDSIACEFVHSLGGKAAQVEGQPEPPFGGNYICLGNVEVLKASTPHSDVNNCFMCRLRKEGNNMIGKVKRKFITQVFRYATDPSGQQAQVPFQLALLVWQFSDKQYRSLHTIQQQWGPIRERDLLLQSDQQEYAFKQWAVQALPDIMLNRDPSFGQIMQQAWATQAVPPTDLERILGKTPENEQEVMAKLAEIMPVAPAQQYAQLPQPGAAPMGYPQPQGFPQPPQVGMAPPAVGQPYAPAPETMYPQAGPFDQAQQYAQPPAVGQPAPMGQPGMVPPAMPMTPPPAQQAAPPLPQAPPVGQPAQAQYAPQQAPPPPAAPLGAPPAPQQQYAPQQAPQMPQGAPPMAPPQMPGQAPPAPQQPQQAPPGVPQMPAPQAPPQQMAPPVTQPGAVAQPGAPADAGAVDYANLLNAPPPPPA